MNAALESVNKKMSELKDNKGQFEDEERHYFIIIIIFNCKGILESSFIDLNTVNGYKKAITNTSQTNHTDTQKEIEKSGGT